MKRLFLLIALLLPAVCMMAQEVTRAVMVGFGSSNQLDTYLSPMEYKGKQFSFLVSRERMTHWMGGDRISFQSMMQGVFSGTDNPAGNASDWGGRIAYDAGWHYHWHAAKGLQLLTGAQVGADLGFLYNDRNGNNPAQGRAGIDLAASAGGIYDFHLRKLPMQLRYQADLPLMGAMFSPQYGQSYYEISQGNDDHNVCFSHPGNALSLRQLVTLDLIFRRTTLRVGYMSDIRQSHVNGIKMHDISRSFMLGYVRYFSILNRDERKEAHHEK